MALLPWIMQSLSWDGKGIWFEPFLGSGAVGFNVAPQRALFSDNNVHIIDFYKAIQSKEITAEDVYDFLSVEGEKLAQTTVNEDSYYYTVRDRFNEEGGLLDFLFLCRANFNGLMRFNSKGGFNSPFCHRPYRYHTGTKPTGLTTRIASQVRDLETLMEGKDWTFISYDFGELLTFPEMISEEDFVYCDPPYISTNTTYYDTWDEQDAVDLARVVKGLPCGWAVSMLVSKHGEMNPHMEDWVGFSQVITTEHTFRVGPKVENRPLVIEGLIVKPGFTNTKALTDAA